MVFGGTVLARRIERAECRLIEECTAMLRRGSGDEAFLIPIAGGAAAFSGVESPLTKVVGLGFAGSPEDGELARIEAEFAARGATVQIELSTLAESGIAERLTARGYSLAGFENVLARELDPSERCDERPGITVDPSGADELEIWLDVFVTAFATLEPQGVKPHEFFPRENLERVLRGLAGTRGLERFLARRGGEPAGGASFRAAAGIALLCGAGTLPAHRRRGVQAAMLLRRLSAAAQAGCDLAVVTTLPGSKSQQNVQRLGFALLYSRAILRRSPAS
jgi:GNAT superfamily N-acetyltransferase